MASIFSVQNLQTFLRRKYLRPPGPPSRPPPPGPERGGRRSLLGPSDEDDGLVSSAIMLLGEIKIVVGRSSLVVGLWACFISARRFGFCQRRMTNDQRRLFTPYPLALRLSAQPVPPRARTPFGAHP